MNKKKLVYKGLLIVPIILFFILENGCKKPHEETIDTPGTDTVVVTPPTPVDTVSYIKKIEAFYSSGQGWIHKSSDITFYYDSVNRLTQVGFKNYGEVLFDTATSDFYYSGNSTKPYMIISPSTQNDYGMPVFYDTTYFQYNSKNQLVSDSSMDDLWDFATYTFKKRPAKRVYTYVDSTIATITWYGVQSLDGPVEILKIDSLDQFNYQHRRNLRSLYHPNVSNMSYYISTVIQKYSSYINPLAKLNISGTTFSLIYKANSAEIFGNDLYKVGFNINMIPHYIDFYSDRLPSSFYVGSYNNVPGSSPGGIVTYFINVKPWEKRESYPSEITVMATTSYPGDKMVYKYYYR